MNDKQKKEKILSNVKHYLKAFGHKEDRIE